MRSLLAGVVLVACGPKGGTDVGNGVAEVDLRGYEQKDPPQSTQQALSLSSGAVLSRVLLVVDQIRLQPGEECDSDDDDDRVDIEGPLVADLVGGGFLGGSRVFGIPVGPFCELRVDYHKVDSDEDLAGTLPELDGLTIYVEGARSDGTAFAVRSDLNEQLHVKAKDGSFQLAAGAHALLLAYELGSWITALDLDTLTGDPIVVDDANNDAALDAFEDAVKASARLFRDKDKDGTLDAAEALDALAEVED